MKNGIKTTEFWLTLVGSITALVVALNILSAEEGQAASTALNDLIKAVAVLAPIIGPIFYNNGRAKIKAKDK